MTFKTLSDILQADQRFVLVIEAQDEAGEPRPWTLGDQHELMRPLNLSSKVPTDVQEKFDTARNIFVYAWFDYELHTVAEQYGYVVVEMALKARHKMAGIEPPKRRGLAALFHSAIKHGWIQAGDYKVDAPHMPEGFFSSLDFMSTMRNHITHGEAYLSPWASQNAIARCAHFINQLFEATGAASS